MSKKKSIPKPKKSLPKKPFKKKFKPLDPKNDAVFKALFAAPEMKSALIGLLSAFLEPEQPIVDLDVLNPEINIKYFKQRGCVLDILVKLDNGTHVDIEMQMSRKPALQKRALYYWGRTYTRGLGVTEPFSKLHPTVVIFFLNHIEFSEMPLVVHHRFSVTHDLDPTVKHRDFRLHYVELRKIPLVFPTNISDNLWVRWAQFLQDPNHPELQEYFMGDRNIKKAKERLRDLSADPKIQELARMRENADHDWASMVEEATLSGMEKGMEKGALKKQHEILKKILKSGLGAHKSAAELAEIVGCSVAEVLAVQKSL